MRRPAARWDASPKNTFVPASNRCLCTSCRIGYGNGKPRDRDIFAEEPNARLKALVTRFLPLFFAAGLSLALAGLLYFVSQASKERDEALASQRHSFLVMNIARALDATISRSESTLARYVISTDKDVGRVYQSEWRLARQQLDLLARETRKDSRQKALVAQLREAYMQRGTELNDIALRTSYDQQVGSLA